eukprot:gene19846-26539_t
MAPIKNQRISWVSEPGSTSMQGVEIANRGQIRFVRKGAQAVNITLTISYEVPDVLLLTPVVEGVISTDMERFRDFAVNKEKLKAEGAPEAVASP